jgi:anti-anti-sigma factor
VPLYACEQCGFTSAAFRNDAAAAHRVEYPDCDGVMRIIFRSDERYRGHGYGAAAVGAEAPRRRRRPHPPPAQTRPAFALREHREPDGTLRLLVLGDLDFTAADTLSTRLAELKAFGLRARIDLSKLAFIDSSGIQALLAALTDARWTGWPLEVAREVSPAVDRAAQIVGISEVLWPQHSDTKGGMQRP